MALNGSTLRRRQIERSRVRGKSMSLDQLVEHFRKVSGQSSVGPRPRNSYASVAAVFACVRARAEAVAMMPLMIATTGDQIIESGPLAELAECPSPIATASLFWRSTSSYFDLFGRCHWLIDRDAAGRPASIVPVNPLQMTAEVDRNSGELIGWRFRAAGRLSGQEQFLPVEDVHTILDPNFEDPWHPHDGLSPRHAIASEIAQLWKSNIANEASLDNHVEPGMVMTVPGSMTEAQRNDLRSVINERHAGVQNRRTYLVLEGGMDVKTLQAAYKDMEFTTLRKMNRTDVCAVFGVPPPVVGFFEDSNFAHADAASRDFWIRTIQPLGARFAEEWELAVLASFDSDRSISVSDAARSAPDVRQRCCTGFKAARKRLVRRRQRFVAWFDSSGIPAVQKAQLEQAETAERFHRMGVPLNDLTRAFDLPWRDDYAWGDTWYKPIATIDVREDTLPGLDDPTGAEPVEPTIGPTEGDGRGRGRSARLPGQLPAARKGQSNARRAGVTPVSKADVNEATLARLWLAWRQSWAGVERKVKGRYRNHFATLKRSVLSRLNENAERIEGKSLTPDHRRDLIGEILFDILEENGKLMARVGPLIRDAQRLGGEQVMQDAAAATGQAKPGSFDFDAEVERKLRRRLIRMSEPSVTLRRRLAGTLADGFAEGQSVAELSERVSREFNVSFSRAQTIARTEVGAAVEEAAHEGRRQAGVPLKAWLWSRKESGRPSHQQTELQTRDNPIPLEQDFVIAGEGVTCPHPRATGRPDHDINCGCTVLNRFPQDSFRDVIARYAAKGFLTYEQLQRRTTDDSTPTTKGTEAEACPVATTS